MTVPPRELSGESFKEYDTLKNNQMIHFDLGSCFVSSVSTLGADVVTTALRPLPPIWHSHGATSLSVPTLLQLMELRGVGVRRRCGFHRAFGNSEQVDMHTTFRQVHALCREAATRGRIFNGDSSFTVALRLICVRHNTAGGDVTPLRPCATSLPVSIHNTSGFLQS